MRPWVRVGMLAAARPLLRAPRASVIRRSPPPGRKVAREGTCDRPTHQDHAVVAVVGVAAIISLQHTYQLVTSHGETGATAHLLPFTVDGLI
jgi:hypothetical protein